MPLFRRTSSTSRKKTQVAEQPEISEQSPKLLMRLSRPGSNSSLQNDQAASEQAKSPPPGERFIKDDHIDQPATHRRSSSQSSRKSRSDEPRAVSASVESESDDASAGDRLSKDDIKKLFFGAPHFMLEKGRHGKAFPQTFFPWNNELEIGDLQDRQWLQHDAFTIATLHAHLPIPDKSTWRPSALGPLIREDAWKRPGFDLSVFEIPNMLSLDGKERGTVAMRYFLELPFAENLRTLTRAKEEENKRRAPGLDDTHVSNLETLKGLKHGESSATIGKHAPYRDRYQLIQQGPRSWDKIGVREIDTKAIIDRLSKISSWHDEILTQGFHVSVLDKERCGALYSHLFGELLYPPETITDEEDPRGLKVQIEALVKVLTTPGAWVDFSLVEWRIRLGQVLWELPPHQRYDPEASNLATGSERKWMLIQILLAIELVVRLDAALRLGVAQKSEQFHLSSYEIHHFNKLRNDKVDWDLVVARRFLDAIYVKQSSVSFSKEAHDTSHPGLPHRFSSLKLKRSGKDKADSVSIWDCALLPRVAKLQVEGLVRFAQMIGWPTAENIEKRLTAELLDSGKSPEELYAFPISSVSDSNVNLPEDHGFQFGFKGPDSFRRAFVTLQSEPPHRVGGWLSRSWLTGLVIPGEALPDFLMSCLIENDATALKKLGRTACLHGGFILDSRSWWSKFCVIGRVFAPLDGSTECRGWINTPRLTPVDPDGQVVSEGWLEITTRPVPSLRSGFRICDGKKLADESSPLGTGHGKVLSKEFLMLTDDNLKDMPTTSIKLNNVVFKHGTEVNAPTITRTASVTFEIGSAQTVQLSRSIFDLNFDVYFISAYPCRLPPGHAAFSSESNQAHRHHQGHGQLPSHPLHKTFSYALKSLTDLPESLPPDPTRHDSVIWIIDARGPPEKEIFARAWCSRVGANALVARIGKTCLSCAIREAKGLEVGLVIRVGAQS